MTPETMVTVKRNVYTGDGMGGKTAGTPSTIAEDVPASFRRYSASRKDVRTEQATGIQIEERRVVVLYDPVPPYVEQNDLVIDQETQTTWVALTDGRRYPHSYQIDVRRMS